MFTLLSRLLPVALAPALLTTAPLAAQTAVPVPASAPADARLEQKSGREMELRGIEDTLKASEAQRSKIEAEVEAIRADRARLNAALIDTSARIKDGETRIAAAERRLDTMTGSEEAIRRSLDSRRGTIAQVLAALQRMGRNPPPAILVRPQDMLEAIRISMLLGAVVPELRAETEALAGDLRELVRLRTAIAGERDKVKAELAGLAEERVRVAALVEARQASLTDAELALDAERQRARELVRQAASLKDVIARLEADIAASRNAAEQARRADEARAAAQTDAVRAKLATAPFKDPARLSPAVSFVETRGMLPLPASGAVLKAYGVADGFGGTERGLSLATRPGAVVTTPADGWIVYAGPYRTYGQLLIVNAGNGYYIVMAGMERVHVETGQFVLAGEPVGTMGDGAAKTAAALVIGAAEPVLYVEFRKDGAAIDPSPWWAKPETEKVRG